jgi:methyl-accepting chemotaxis protein
MNGRKDNMKKKQFGISISLRLVIYISVVILLICSFITVFASIISRDILKNEANATLTEIAKQAADTVSAKVDSSFSSLKILQKNSMFLYPEEYKKEIKDLLSGQINKDGCVEITVIDKNGKSFWSMIRDRDLSNEAYSKKAIKGQKFVTNPFYNTPET